MRFALFAGTRPEIIKLLPVHRALCAKGAEADLIVLAQQPELLAPMLADVDHSYLPLARTSGTLLELAAEIGRVLGVTESRVCQIHTKAVFQLRGRIQATEREPV